MTEQKNDTTPEETPDESVVPTETETKDNPNAEAAKYRRRLREAEQERDALTEQLATMQRDMFQLRNNIADEQMEKITGSDPDDMQSQLEAFKSFGPIPGHIPTTGTGDPRGGIDAEVTWRQALDTINNGS